MYGPLRDLFVQVLNYAAADVDIDVTGEGGRPDLTVRAPSGLIDLTGNSVKVAWIVVEAKDEHGVFANPNSREEIFDKKAKYVGPHTAWFVMVDPTVWIARQIGNKDRLDIVIPFDGVINEGDFSSRAFHATCRRSWRA